MNILERMENYCAFTSKDQGLEFDSMILFSIVFSWSKAWDEIKKKYDLSQKDIEILNQLHKYYLKLKNIYKEE